MEAADAEMAGAQAGAGGDPPQNEDETKEHGYAKPITLLDIHAPVRSNGVGVLVVGLASREQPTYFCYAAGSRARFVSRS